MDKEESVRSMGSEEAMYLGEVDNLKDDGCKSYQLPVQVLALD